MSILNQLSSSLNRRDEIPNQELARALAEKGDRKGVREVVGALQSGNQNIKNDCIKVLYEVGELKPELISEYLPLFVDLLKSKNNRLVWGGMTALSTLTTLESAILYERLPEIIDGAYRGSVIAKDHAVKILVALAGVKEYTDDVQLLLLDRLRTSPDNQFPTYAEKTGQVITEPHKSLFLSILHARLEEIEQESKRKRVEKVIRRIEKGG
ncbi:MAG: hypothetical protein KDD67_06495 [Ignavibacteriae bacterium]|nr:hypothetical protein [Ignavibacteriota bacterium]MCB9215585.1 hypothetical protein [Ignavibacteria bacterium]